MPERRSSLPAALWRRVRSAAGAVWGGVHRFVVGYAEELAVAVGAHSIALGFWWTWRPGAFFVIGGVILWLTLPSRAPFIDRLPEDAGAKRRKST